MYELFSLWENVALSHSRSHDSGLSAVIEVSIQRVEENGTATAKAHEAVAVADDARKFKARQEFDPLESDRV